MNQPSHSEPRPPLRDGLGTYFVLACASTWLLAAPLALAWSRRQAPSPLVLASAGLSALGPLFAALMAARAGQRRHQVWGRFGTPPHWIAGALLTPLALHLTATLLYAVMGGHVTAWLHPPITAEQLTALIVFPLGEEFGWRGFAHARMQRRFGSIRGPLLLGLVWGIWHLVYAVTPAGDFDTALFSLGLVELPLYSLLIAWVFERSQRSMLVAIAFHAGAHLDHLERATRENWGLHALHITVLSLLASLAARSLHRARDQSGT